MPAATTPMMKQYLSIKEQNPDSLLFFRLGDFYEMFQEDAVIAARELELALTTRDRNKPEGERTPMCGVPYHAAESYIARLIAKGYKVAVCEQTEDPALAKGIVEREVVRVVTPGTVIAETMLEEGRNNFICAILGVEDVVGLAFCDLSTGELWTTVLADGLKEEHLYHELGRFAPKEVLLAPALWQEVRLTEFLTRRLGCCLERGEAKYFDLVESEKMTREHFGTLLEEGIATPALCATGALLSHLYATQKTDLSHLRRLQSYELSQFMELDLTARQTLELTQTMRTGEKKGSLLGVLDRTKTPMGRRLIRTWMERPLLSPALIGKRQDCVGALVGDMVGRDDIQLLLREVGDLERLIGRIVYGTAGGKDLVALSSGLRKIPAIKAALGQYATHSLFATLVDAMADFGDLCDYIDSAIVDEPPFSVREGGIIRDGHDPEVDRLRKILTGGAQMILDVETREKEATGIKNLKVRYNKVFGYYIEVSKSYYDMVPEGYIRKQTLANCERFITQELKEMEADILSAKDKVTSLEYQIFNQIRQGVAAQVGHIQQSAAAVAQVDVLASFAQVAAQNNYCRPQVDLSHRIDIVDGRHPVVERMLKDSLFVPNDTTLAVGEDTVAIITGPNMAGKSTYMRQVAILVLMAQMGAFVPARSATIGIVDRVFTRIGASDDLSGGASTFMVEMAEVAELLNHATPKSLIVLDEVGRGTATYDGMAIARAVLEYCANPKKLGCRTLFATHYHELTVLEGEIGGVKNYSIAAKKKGDGIIFLRKIIRGGADQSFGIEVAKLAGVPESVIRRGREILAQLEGEGLPAPKVVKESPAMAQMGFEDTTAQEVAESLKKLDLNTLTPIEAMNVLFTLKKQVE